MPDELIEIAVVGTGPAGLVAAGLLEQSGHTVALVGLRPRASVDDVSRTAALFPANVAAVSAALGPVDKAWIETLQPLTGIRILDGMGGLLRAPDITFRAGDIDVDRLATNVPLALLTEELARALASRPRLRWIEETVAEVVTGEAHVDLVTGQGRRLRSSLLVAADGRESLARRIAGIECTAWSYDQTAIVAAFEHSAPHRGISTEIHRPGGPCTTVPLPGNRSSLVWLERAAIASRLMALDDAAFLETLSHQVGGHCGRLSKVTPRASLPMRGLTARTLAQNRVLLVGETAHVFPPVGAQGLNLTIRDIVAAERILSGARRAGHDIGGHDTLGAYDRARRGDVRIRARGVDLMNSILLADWPLPNLARGAALHAIAAVPALKRQVMRAGMG